MLRTKYQLNNLVHNPEFLTARCSVVDAQCPTRNIIGGEIITGTCLATLYAKRFPGVPVLRMSSTSSELVKLGQNAFFATKVAFFNELRTLVDASGAKWDDVLAGVMSDGRITHAHTQVPGPDGQYGFGGECLPKDLAGLVHSLKQHKLPCVVTHGAILRNEHDRKRR
jgi:UDPglucose 6-dehydrogenase